MRITKPWFQQWSNWGFCKIVATSYWSRWMKKLGEGKSICPPGGTDHGPWLFWNFSPEFFSELSFPARNYLILSLDNWNGSNCNPYFIKRSSSDDNLFEWRAIKTLYNKEETPRKPCRKSVHRTAGNTRDSHWCDIRITGTPRRVGRWEGLWVCG